MSDSQNDNPNLSPFAELDPSLPAIYLDIEFPSGVHKFCSNPACIFCNNVKAQGGKFAGQQHSGQS